MAFTPTRRRPPCPDARAAPPAPSPCRSCTRTPRASTSGPPRSTSACPLDRDPQPIRRFGTFTEDLHALATWLPQCGVTSVAMESTGVYWIPLYQILETPRLRGVPGERPAREERPGPEDRRPGLPVAPVPALGRPPAGLLPPAGDGLRRALPPPAPGHPGPAGGHPHPAHAEGPHPDEPPAPPRAERHHRRHGPGHPRRHPGGGAGPRRCWPATGTAGSRPPRRPSPRPWWATTGRSTSSPCASPSTPTGTTSD